jgi:hypothetical protein
MVLLFYIPGVLGSNLSSETALNDWIIVNNELETMWKEVAMI